MNRNWQTFILIAAFLVLGASAWGQIGLVRVTECGPKSFPSTCAIPATGSGNLIVVATMAANYGSISSVTDNAGNTYAQASGARTIHSGYAEAFDFWYAGNSRAGATSISITPSASGNGMAVVWEFAGADPISPFARAAVLSDRPASSTPTGAAVTTTDSGELVVTLLVTGTTSGIRSGNPFIHSSGLAGDGFAYYVAPSPGTYAAQWNTTSTPFSSSTVAFRPASGGPPPTTKLNECDLTSDGVVDSGDVQAAVNMTLGTTACTANLLGAGVCNVAVVQRIVNASLGGACVVGTTVPRSVDLTWVASASTGVLGYNVYRSETAGGPYNTPINASLVTGTTYTDSTVLSGKTYYYTVRAKDATQESGPSNEAVAVIPPAS